MLPNAFIWEKNEKESRRKEMKGLEKKKLPSNLTQKYLRNVFLLRLAENKTNWKKD